jgi:diguanylate cyclase
VRVDKEAARIKNKAHVTPARLSDEEMRVLTSAGVSRAVLPGEELFARGDNANSMFLIDTGNVRLSFDESVADKVLGPGQYFGELAVFIGHHQRFARAITESSGVIYEISEEAFEQLCQSEPNVMAQFMRRSFAYLVAAEQQLIQSLRRRNEDLMQTLDTLRQTRSELSVAQQLVRSDELTGLSNRRGLYRYLDEMGQYPVQQQLALMLVDIDDFKEINDIHGHLAGDSTLRAVAEEVRRLCGPLELPARLGGDEFALILRVTDDGELGNRALDLISNVRALRLSSTRGERIDVSVGAAICKDIGNWSAWYSQADEALYRAKKNGGGRWALATKA